MNPKYFFNPWMKTTRHGHALPHWEQTETLTFLSWRLKDSIPAEVSRQWIQEHRKFEKKDWNDTNSRQDEKLFEEWDSWLDKGLGSCILSKPEGADCVSQAFHHFHNKRYMLLNFVIMPNHVHLLYLPDGGFSIEAQVKSWKTWTSRNLRPLAQEPGPIWQKGYWDTLMRDPVHLYRTFRYIKRNPGKANLQHGFLYWENPNLPDYLKEILSELLD